MKIILCILIFFIFLPGPVSAQKVAQFPELANPFLFYPDDGRIFITEGVTTFIYSARDYKLLKKFGKEGEGPGEVMLRRGGGTTEIYLVIQPDHIINTSIDKLIYFSKNGEFIKEKKTSAIAMFLTPIGEFYAGFKYTRGDGGNRIASILVFNSQLEKTRTIYSQVHNWSGPNVEFNPLVVEPPLFEVGGDVIFVANEELTFLRGYSTGGGILFEITPKNKPVPFTQKDKDEMIAQYKRTTFWKRYYEIRKSMFKFPAYFPPIRFFNLDRPGKKVYISTNKTAEGERTWLVYDFKGNFIKEITLPAEGIFQFFKGKCYRLAENEDEEIWELFITPMF